ncbi:MAG: hypothetical protein SGJ20_15785 [Planctomycetota bacterium]|nr:hypothetical protein [Planctomycetota bacterium]
MTWLLEDPTAVVITSAVVVAALVFFLMQSGRVMFFYALLGVILVATVLVVVERYVVTEYEEVEQTIAAAAEALESNDIDRILTFVDPAATSLQQEVRRELKRTTIDTTKVRDLQVTFDRSKNPPTATAKFFANVQGKYYGTQGTFVSNMTVTFVRQGDKWLATSYVPESPFGKN